MVSGQSANVVATRLRLRGDFTRGDGLPMRPFAGVNWWHGPQKQTTTFGGIAVTDPLPANRVEGSLARAISLWGALGYQAGGNDYHGAQVQMGVKYTW
ncbi:autotransporter outer membrane beta-barrel domain-containing protein [Dyella solisilvae]|uniref:Autotransporter outer membrane beta-barrel domain-containing protein n=1 Tax=Dyella solisilvae TaxID=1920168 RepID=A0A370KAS0_9GAMM|nr:autotransporter outer membrane beta-barrel domain-containing protein [Dyella solisilvae]